MLISNDIELRQFLPSSVVEDVETISMLIERAEDAHLRPVLGDSLYDEVCRLHDNGVDKKEDSSSDEMKEYQLVTLCQSAAIYFAMADNVGILSVSYNVGGGFSIVSTDGYAPADEKEKDRLERDLWKNAWRDIDRLLDLLEKDARSKSPKWAEMWIESEWFWQQGDLLVSTAKEVRRYLKSEEMRCFGRKEFVEMLGDLRFVQMSFISQAIGGEFLEWLVAYDRTRTNPAAQLPDTGNDASGELPDTGGTAVNDKVVKKAKEYLCMALLAAMRYRRDHKGADENDANLALFRACEYIRGHQSEFGTAIETSPLYVAPVDDYEGTDAERKNCRRERRKDCDRFDGHEALFVPFM